MKHAVAGLGFVGKGGLSRGG